MLPTCLSPLRTTASLEETTMTRCLCAAGLALSLTLVASPAPAKGLYWYTRHSCMFYPGGGARTPGEIATCRRQKAMARAGFRFCRDPMRRGPLPCDPNQAVVWTLPRE